MLTLINLTWICPTLPMHFSFSIQAGERVAVLGPSGSGKSTLLNLIAGFLTPHRGHIILNGIDHTYTVPAKRPVSILFQENNLFAHLNVAQNIGLGLHPGLKLNTIQHKHVTEIAKRVGLTSKLRCLPSELSGGQRQRVALARCLVRAQPILLLDEPFSNLDPALRKEMLALVDEVCYDNKLTLLIVSHSLSDVQQIAARSILVVDGYIYWEGTTAVLLHGKTKAAKILGINYRIVDHSIDKYFPIRD